MKGHLERGPITLGLGDLHGYYNYLHPSWEDPPSGSFPFSNVCGGINGLQTILYTQVTTNLLGGGFKYVLFSPLLGEDSHFDLIFFNWVETTNQIY